MILRELLMSGFLFGGSFLATENADQWFSLLSQGGRKEISGLEEDSAGWQKTRGPDSHSRVRDTLPILSQLLVSATCEVTSQGLERNLWKGVDGTSSPASEPVMVDSHTSQRGRTSPHTGH